jgi:5-methyltetrahydropteroyltriglutamate--homocysteine methyltransferase
MTSSAPATNLGFPRIGARRELKRSLEDYWSGEKTAGDLAHDASELRKTHWNLQRACGIDHIPSNDFSLYDHVLDTAVMVGAIPDRYRNASGGLDLDSYFAMARGRAGPLALSALEMTKWFDTNYHYIVPEIAPGQTFELASEKPVEEFLEAKELGITTRPVLLGPISFLLLARLSEPGAALSHLPSLLGVYEKVLVLLGAAGASWVQIDEPALGLDLDDELRQVFPRAYAQLFGASSNLKILLATYYSGLRKNLPLAASLSVDAVHLDLVSEPSQLDAVLELKSLPEALSFSLGVVDGRNIWRCDLEASLHCLEKARSRIGLERVLVAPSCSLIHLPVSLEQETALDPSLRSWLSFATERLQEVVVLARGLNEGGLAIEDELRACHEARVARRDSLIVNDPAVQDRIRTLGNELEGRRSPFSLRRKRQAERLGLPILPTTTIGSFPQTSELRALRARFRKHEINAVEYEAAIENFIAEAIHLQEETGLDVLVHGEFERTDMVEYFAESLRGFAFTRAGWVQSYGSRCVKPPIIFGDVSRPDAMTLRWATYAQSLTQRPVKGMLTGPVTILAWSFVRDDQPRELVCYQVALSVRDEVSDLEESGIAIIQIDEPALREELPLHHDDRASYLAWAVRAFRIASSGVADQTQIHTHMCYADFGDIIDAISAFDADVISFEASRSKMDLLQSFVDYDYPNEIGPGVWDVHSPRVPATEEIVELIERALSVLDGSKLWINPDCGLKTRRWEEVKPTLRNLVAAAEHVRTTLTS